MTALVGMWGMFKKYDRWSDVAAHVLSAQREILSALLVLMGGLREAAAPFAKEDPLASVLHEVFRFFERAIRMVMPFAPEGRDRAAMQATQRRAMLAIRGVLLDERAAITPHPEAARFRTEVIDSILRVLDLELARIGHDEDFHDVDNAALDEDTVPVNLDNTPLHA